MRIHNRFIGRLLAPGSLLLLVAAAFAGAPRAAHAATLTESFDRTFPLAAGGTLSVGNTNGAITVEVWDRNEVQVEAQKRVKAATEERAHELMSRLQVEVVPAAGNLSVSTRSPTNEGFLAWLFGGGGEAQVEYHLHVPRRVVLSVKTINGSVMLAGTEGNARLRSTNGGLKVTGARGLLDLQTTNGGINVSRSAGGVHAETTNGSIEVELTRVTDSVALESTNGGLTVRVPRDLRATVDAGTTNGSVHSDLEVATTAASRKRHLRGAINGGGPELRLSTTNGGIRIYSL
jgi:hypothetical protein